RFENEAVQRVARLQHLSSPCKRRAPDVVLAKGLRVNRRGGETILVSFGFQLLRRIQMAPRDLEAKVANWGPGNAGRITIQLGRFDVVAVLVRLTASKR